MKLVVKGIEYECVSATKTENEVKIVDINGEIATFSGIENISDYVLEGGEWSPHEQTSEERIAVLDEQIAQADETAIALYEAQEEQEAINAQQDEALMEIYEMIG